MPPPPLFFGRRGVAPHLELSGSGVYGKRYLGAFCASSMPTLWGFLAFLVPSPFASEMQ